MATSRIENTTSPHSVAHIAQFDQKELATQPVVTPTFKVPSKGNGSFLEKLFNIFRFAASATVGIPLAASATAFLGSLYLIAEATDIVETNVKSNFKGDKKVYHNPFFQKISDGLGYALGRVVTETAGYAPISAYTHVANFIQDHTTTGLKVNAMLGGIAASNPELMKQLDNELANVPSQNANPQYVKQAARNEIPHIDNEVSKFAQELLSPSRSPQSPHGVVQEFSQGRS